jgi:hypothetical protein
MCEQKQYYGEVPFDQLRLVIAAVRAVETNDKEKELLLKKEAAEQGIQMYAVMIKKQEGG